MVGKLGNHVSYNITFYISSAELVFVVSGTTNMYPGYGIVYKNVPIFWSLPKYVPCIRPHVPCVFKYRDRNHVTWFSASVTAISGKRIHYHCTSKWIFDNNACEYRNSSSSLPPAFIRCTVISCSSSLEE